MLKSFTRKWIAISCLVFVAQGVFAQWSNNIIPHFRTGNAVFIINNQSAVIAGGNETLDSIQTLSRTDDRTLNWGINLDIIKPWLKSVYYITDSIGIAVGYDGTILRCTDGGTNWTKPVAPGNTYQRHFNSVYFANSTTGYIAGGWPSNDSIQTILKTTDGGITWSVQRDNPGFWLRSIYFTDAQHGVAVGDNGTILKTTDGGSNWNAVTLTGNIANRRFNEVEFINASTGFIVGGNKSNDSIQTILKTTDGGDTWSVITDNIGSMLNGIDFASLAQAYAVGDKGVILSSSNSGDTWAPLNLPFSINDSADLYAVNFLNVDFGIAVGKSGKMLVYQNPLPVLPVVATSNATEISATGAKFNGVVSTVDSAYVVFEYGTTNQLGDSILASPSVAHNVTNLSISKVITGLLPNTFYYYRIKAGNASGSNVGVVKQFYTADCEIPNCSFENWDTLLFDVPVGWTRIGMSHKVASYNGTNAVEVYGGTVNKMGGVVAGLVGNDFPTGGFPITMQPDSLKCRARYNIVPGDTAFLAIIFKQGGQVSSLQTFPITGTTGGAFVEVKGDITFPNSDVPDSAIIGVLSSNTFNEALSNPNSVLAVDDIAFTGSTDVIPNGNFEQWTNELFDMPAEWYTIESDNGNNVVNRIDKITDAAGGNYALKISNETIGGKPSFALVGRNSSSDLPVFPVGGKHQTFNLYLKYFPQGGDTLNVSAMFFNNGAPIGYAWMNIDTLVPNYKGFEMMVDYQGSSLVPDSASVSVRLGSDTSYGGSIAYVDLLSFDGFKQTVGLQEADDRALLCIVYPNPANQVLQVSLVNNRPSDITCKLINLQGQLVLQTTNFKPGGVVQEDLPVNNIAEGQYLLSVSNGIASIQKRVVIIHTR